MLHYLGNYGIIVESPTQRLENKLRGGMYERMCRDQPTSGEKS